MGAGFARLPAAAGRPVLSTATGCWPLPRPRIRFTPAQVQDCPPAVHRLRWKQRHQPRLRSRLTLGRLPLPRNPQACGVGGSHTQSNATHSGIRTSVRSTRACRSGFSATPERSPTTRSDARAACKDPAGRRVGSAASGGRLSPVELSARCHSTSELLRTLSRMAASKPTSWLSAHHHNLSH